jgi:hypothetical protein
MELLVEFLALPDRGEQAFVHVSWQGLAAGLSVQNDRALERSEESPGALAMLDVQHELRLEFIVEFAVEVFRQALNESLAVVYV